MRKNTIDLGFVASVMFALMLFVGPWAAPALAGDEHDVGLGFHFLSQSVDPAAGDLGHTFFMSGTGKFNHQYVTGGGFYNHFDNATGLLATGKWRAERLVSYEQVENENIPLGFVVAGILVAEVRPFPEGGPSNGVPATPTVVCNVGSVGAFTGFTEGYFLDVAGLSFEPATFPDTGFPVGVTAFSVGGTPDEDSLSLQRIERLTKIVAVRVGVNVEQINP